MYIFTGHLIKKRSEANNHNENRHTGDPYSFVRPCISFAGPYVSSLSASNLGTLVCTHPTHLFVGRHGGEPKVELQHEHLGQRCR